MAFRSDQRFVLNRPIVFFLAWIPSFFHASSRIFKKSAGFAGPKRNLARLQHAVIPRKTCRVYSNPLG